MSKLRKRIRDWEEFNALDISAWRNHDDDTKLTEEEKKSLLAARTAQEEGVKTFLLCRIPKPSPSELYEAPQSVPYNPEYHWGTPSPLLNTLWRTNRQLALLRIWTDLLKMLLCFGVGASAFLAPDQKLSIILGLSLVAIIILDWVFLGRIRASHRAHGHEEFGDRFELAMVWVQELPFPKSWAVARYSLAVEEASVGPEGNTLQVRGKTQPYEWQEIEPGKYMIADKQTGKEAPIRPAIAKYVR